jgi:hypothetical protein
MARTSWAALPVITAWAALAGAVMATGAVSLFCIVVVGEPPGFVLQWTPVMAVGGAVMGLLSACYLVPLLMGTSLTTTLPVVLGVSTAAGIGMGMLHPLLGAMAALAAQLTLAGAFWSARRTGSGRSRCRHCGFDCRGVRDDLCPECGFGGPDWAVRNPTLCACCGAKWVDKRECAACGARDFNAADWRDVLKRSGR